jgi:hypothetical protein
MEHATIPHERDRLNDEIERAYIETSACIIDIMTFLQTKRGKNWLQLYEDFYRWFSYLVEITSDLTVVIKHGQDQINVSNKWINLEPPGDDDRNLRQRCNDGIRIFREYKKMLGQQGVISLPSG